MFGGSTRPMIAVPSLAEPQTYPQLADFQRREQFNRSYSTRTSQKRRQQRLSPSCYLEPKTNAGIYLMLTKFLTGRGKQKTAAGQAGVASFCRRRCSILAFISGAGQSSSSHCGSGSPAPLTGRASSSSLRPLENSSNAQGIS